jgi:hypothetical protein
MANGGALVQHIAWISGALAATTRINTDSAAASLRSETSPMPNNSRCHRKCD